MRGNRRKAAALEEPIEKLKADYALVRSEESKLGTRGRAHSSPLSRQVTKTLRTALELPDDPEPVTPRS